jgi:hypothetical protein
MKSRAGIREKVWTRFGTAGVIKRKRGGPNKGKHSGPSGWKAKPARVLARAMADVARAYKARRAATGASQQ